MNTELVKAASEKVGNPNILVNLISRRVRQLNAAGGAGRRPLIVDPGTMGAADVALTEIVEGKMGWEVIEALPSDAPAPRKRSKKQTSGT